MEECFQTAKDQVGLDQYQVNTLVAHVTTLVGWLGAVVVFLVLA